MRLLRVAAGVVLFFVSTLTYAQGGSCPASGGLTYVAALFGSQFGGQGSPRASGTAFLTFDPAAGTVTTTLRTYGVAVVTGATLGEAGAATPALTLDPAALGGRAAIPAAVMNAIVENPSNYTLTVSSIDFPTGSVSGRLLPTATLGGTFSGAAVVGTTRAMNGGGIFRASIAKNPEGGALLNYTAAPTNIGDSLMAIDLWEGAAGSNGRMVAQLADASRLSNGSLSGAVAISDGVAASLLTDPGAYYVVARTSDYPTGAIRTQLGLRLNEVFLPVTGSGRGAGGNRWETAVRIFNASWAPATVAVQRLAGGQSNSSTGGSFAAAQTAVVTIAPRGVATIDTATDQTAGLRDSFGPVVLLSDQPIIATARVYDDARAAGRGTFGATAPGLTRCDSVARGVLGDVSGGGADFPVRTNVGFFNPNPVSVTVNLKLTGSDGTAISTTSLSLRPYEQLQAIATGGNGLFDFAGDLNSGAITFEASAPVFSYASVIDNTSGDSTIAYGQEDAASQAMADGDIADVAIAANQGEIREAVEAMGRASSETVKAYAQSMNGDATEALQVLLEVLGTSTVRPNPNPTSMGLRQDSQSAQDKLASLSGADFDRAYLQREVEARQNTITLLDDVLLPSVRETLLREYLVELRNVISAHLARAQELLKGM